MRVHAGRGAGALAVLLCVMAACGSPSTAVRSRATTTTRAGGDPSTSSSSPMTEPLPSSTATTVAATAGGTRPTTTSAVDEAPAPTTVAVPAGLDRVGSAGQAMVATAPSYGATTATFTAYERTSDGWRQAFGPWSAHVGYNGLAPPGAKREGDGRTPSGVYGFDFLFGVSPDPGVHFPYRRVTPSIVWDDDSNSPHYNQWVDRDQQDPGAEPEEMYRPDVYAYGAVIAYNVAATPGLGSAIFLHATTGRATAGCVSLPVSQLVDVLRWLDPSRAPRIVIGVG